MSAVPATPVVLIDVTGGTVHVNGDLVEHDGTRSLHEVGVHATAERVAQILDRPVRAIAIDEAARVSLVVHPSGETSDVEVLEEYSTGPTTSTMSTLSTTSDELGGESGEAAAHQPEEASQLASVVELHASGARAEPAPAVEDAEPVKASAAGSPRSGLGTNTTAAMLAAAVVVLLGAIGAVLVAGGWSGKPQETEPSPASSRPSVTTPSPAATSAGAGGPVTAQTPPPLVQKVKASAAGGVERIRFRVVATVRPAQALVLVDVPGRAKPVRRLVELEARATVLTVAGLPAGELSWTVQVAGVDDVIGTATVTTPSPPSSGTSGGSSNGTGGSSGGSPGGSSGGSSGGKPGGGVDGGLG